MKKLPIVIIIVMAFVIIVLVTRQEPAIQEPVTNKPTDSVYIESNMEQIPSNHIVLKGSMYGIDGSATGTVRSNTQGSPK